MNSSLAKLIKDYEHVNVATSFNNFALIYQDLGDFEQAKEYQQRALEIQLDKLGPVHVNVARRHGQYFIYNPAIPPYS